MDILERLTNRNMPYGSLVLLDEAAKEIARLRAAFRINAIRDHPEMSHAEIDAEIERIVRGDEQCVSKENDQQ